MVEIRQGNEEDHRWLQEIQRRALAEPTPELLDTAVDGYPPLFVVVDTRLIGYAIVVPGPAEIAYLPEIAIEPNHQREGHGSALLGAVCEALAAEGYERLRLTVMASDDAAQQFYETQGFEQIDRLPDEFERDDGLLLAREL